METKPTSQVLEEGAAVVAGPNNPDLSGEGQPVTETPTEEPGKSEGTQFLEAEPQKPKTYTQEEISQLLSKKDAEIQQHREAVQKLAWERQKAMAQDQEQQLIANDKRDVEQGLITEQDAVQRQHIRQQYTQVSQELQNMVQKAEEVGFMLCAHDIATELAKQEGLDEAGSLILFKQLMSGERPKNPDAMKVKGLQLMRDRLKAVTLKPQTFDKGPGGMVASGNADKIIRRYSEGDPNVTRADYEKAMAQKGLR